MMPHPKDVQPDSSPNSADDLLDASSLNTVLDMLAVIDSVEELALLEVLTPAQKRQVWDATPNRLKIRLKQIRLDYAEGKVFQNSPEQQQIEAAQPEPIDSADLDSTDLTDLPETSDLPESLPDLMASVLQNPLHKVGDRVVLLAHSQLTAAELTAIWQVTEVQADYARIETTALGSRRYPLTWMIIYPG
jgi:hypothetical protein